MLLTYTVCFFGHRLIENFPTAERKVERLVKTLINEHGYVNFLIGREGEFDSIVSSAIVRAKREVFAANSSHTLVLPYLTSELKQNTEAFETYYDSIEICEASSAAHPKAAYQIRNRYMIDRSDLCVFYVEHKSGGAWQTMRYAERTGKPIVNLADGWPNSKMLEVQDNFMRN